VGTVRGTATAVACAAPIFFRHLGTGAGKGDADGKVPSPHRNMTQSKRDSQFDSLVRDWQRPVYGLAVRMLGDSAEAEDATQEVFVRLLRDLDRYDAEREFRPWIYRIATNLILNRIRAAKTRRRIETEAASRQPSAEMDERVERRESDLAVRSSLQDLDSDDRALVVLHFYEGLSKSDVAATLGMPRTTVLSRLDRALSRLRTRLQATGHAALLPVLPQLMRDAAPPPVPPALGESLIQLAATAAKATAPIAGAATIGGIVMTQKTIALVTVIALGSLGIGYFTGTQSTPRAERSRREEAGSEARASEKGLLARAEQAERERDELKGRIAQLNQGTQPEAVVKPKTVAATGIEWSKLGRLLVENFDLLERRRVNDWKGEVSAAEQTKLMGLMSELMRISAQARGVAPRPFFDERVLPELITAIYGDVLKLSEEEQVSWANTTRAVSVRCARDFDAAAALPIERIAQRTLILDELKASLAPHVPQAKRERFSEVEAQARAILAPTQMVITLGIDPEGGADAVGALIVEYWTRAYGLSDEQQQAAGALATRFAADASDRFRQHAMGTPGADAGPYDAKILELQVVIERQLVASLTDMQRANLVQAYPSVFHFRAGDGESSVINNSFGF